MNRKTLSSLFIIVAIVSFTFAIICFSMKTDKMLGGTEADHTYGGDAYTGIQNSAAQAANNAYYAGKNISNLAKCITNISGLGFIICSLVFLSLGIYYGMPVEKTEEINKNNGQPMQSFTAQNVSNQPAPMQYNAPHYVTPQQPAQQPSYRPNIGSAPVPQFYSDGSWKCECGNHNASYVSSCGCGKNKRDIFHNKRDIFPNK